MEEDSFIICILNGGGFMPLIVRLRRPERTNGLEKVDNHVAVQGFEQLH